MLLENGRDLPGEIGRERTVGLDVGDGFDRSELHARQAMMCDSRGEFRNRKFAEIVRPNAEVQHKIDRPNPHVRA